MNSAIHRSKPASSSYPTYPGKASVYRHIFRVAIAGKPRSFRLDACRQIGRLVPPLRVLGQEHIPERGPCLITLNHYNRPGFNAMWIGMAVSAAVPVEVHWMMTSAWTFTGRWYAPVGRWISEWVIQRLARVYGITLTPPMPPSPAEAAQRAAAVRRLMAYARQSANPVIAISPEGQDHPGAALGIPPPGSGRLMQQFARMQFTFLPAAIYEETGEGTIRLGALYLRFGETYILEALPDMEKKDLDAKISQIVMGRIARLLPAHLHGVCRSSFDHTDNETEDQL